MGVHLFGRHSSVVFQWWTWPVLDHYHTVPVRRGRFGVQHLILKMILFVVLLTWHLWRARQGRTYRCTHPHTEAEVRLTGPPQRAGQLKGYTDLQRHRLSHLHSVLLSSHLKSELPSFLRQRHKTPEKPSQAVLRSRGLNQKKTKNKTEKSWLLWVKVNG